MKSKAGYFLFLNLILVFCLSCKHKSNSVEALKEKKEEIVEQKRVSIKVEPFHEKLWSWKKSFSNPELDKLRKEEGSFFDLYTSKIINVGNYKDPKFSFYLSEFLKDPSVTEIYEEVLKQNKDFSGLEKELSDAFTIYNHYFPQRIIPNVKTYVSGFNYAIVVNDSTLGIGLDMFLGKNHSFYKLVGMPEYVSYFMRKDVMVSEAIKGWIESDFFTEDKSDETLLTEMINAGKTLYLLDVILPECADSLKIKYSSKRFTWIKENELKAWQYFIGHKLLYETDYMEKRKYLGDAPFTTGLPRESPPRLAQYFGWQIVRAFMINNPNYTVEQLLNQKDAQFILNKSKYKPEQNINS